MTFRILVPLKAALLAGTAFIAVQHPVSATATETLRNGVMVAQAGQEREGRRERDGKPDGEPGKRDELKRQPPAARPAPDASQQKPQAQQPAAQQQERRDERREQRREERREERAIERRPQQPPAAAQPQQPQQQPTPPAAQERRPQPSTAQPQQRQEPPAAQDRRERRRDEAERDRKPGAQPPAAQQPTQQQQQQPATAQPPQQRQPSPQPPAAQQQQQPPQQAPATAQPQQEQAPAAAPSATAVAPPTQARDAREFIRRGGDGPSRSIEQIRRERREVRDGDRVVIREPDRVIIREGGRAIIRHNEADRFAVGARDVRVERRGGTIETVVERPNGVRIVTVTDADGRLIRRVRRDPRGRDIVIIDNSFASPRATYFVQLPPPVIRIPRERYIVEMHRARPEEIYEVFLAPPVQRVERRYTLEQVRYSPPLRAYMPRVDLDINFDTGSWQITPDQIGKLEVIARGIRRAIDRDPREVFLIEGHTDAVGSDEDNLSLSDRRAESVAVALTEQFDVPPENLVTQGFGEQELKVPTEGPSRENRRVAVRRITPLIDQKTASNGGR